MQQADAVARPPEMTALGYGSISRKRNRVTVVTWATPQAISDFTNPTKYVPAILQLCPADPHSVRQGRTSTRGAMMGCCRAPPPLLCRANAAVQRHAARATTSEFGAFETCRRALRMSGY